VAYFDKISTAVIAISFNRAQTIHNISSKEFRMYINDLVYILLVGLIAGFLAGKIMKGKGFGLVGDLVVGVLGAIVGWWLFGMLGIGGYGLLGSIILALIGALLLLYIVRIVKKRN
jgi:uncharacterized membrane protein YeaQ/YmgE (transglycosylase-associated protein family)